jgi:maleylacetoacetate isomerase
LILYDYFRSSAGYRVRIALGIKGLKVERRPVNLLRGEHRDPAYLTTNPQGLAPALELDDRTVITQSLAIILYLEQLQPAPALLPQDPVLAAKALSVALTIACDTHPLNNPRVVNYLRDELRTPDASLDEWRRHWILKGGLEAVEHMIEPAPFCCGSAPTLADICLIPQLYSARRYETPLDGLPRILAVEAACLKLPAFCAAHPSNQSDAE